MKIRTAFCTFLMAVSLSTNARAEQTWSFEYLWGTDDTTGVRIGYRPRTTDVNELDGFKDLALVKWIGNLEIYWEVSVAEWTNDTLGFNQGNAVIGFSPVFTHRFANIAGKYPLSLEVGVGIALLDRTRYGAEDLGTHIQFEDRLGLTLKFGQRLDHAATLRLLHYSNGGFSEHNPGADFVGLSYQYSFQ